MIGYRRELIGVGREPLKGSSAGSRVIPSGRSCWLLDRGSEKPEGVRALQVWGRTGVQRTVWIERQGDERKLDRRVRFRDDLARRIWQGGI